MFRTLLTTSISPNVIDRLTNAYGQICPRFTLSVVSVRTRPFPVLLTRVVYFSTKGSRFRFRGHDVVRGDSWLRREFVGCDTEANRDRAVTQVAVPGDEQIPTEKERDRKVRIK